MAKTLTNTRRTHVSPGVYTSETDLTYASKSLGITTLGLVGETKKGPAFQPMLIENWRQFQTYFGGTSVEKFKGSQYPKYELPYIAQSYLQQSNQLQVVRVLGLSGYNAGPAWLITASKYNAEGEVEDNGYQNMVIAVIRSRGEYQKTSYIKDASSCSEKYEYDKLVYYAQDVKLELSSKMSLLEDGNCSVKFDSSKESDSIDVLNYGKFTFVVYTKDGDVKKYAVSLNPNDKNYIYNVIGGKAEEGNAEIYVEELYDVALQQLIETGNLNKIDFVNKDTLTSDNFKEQNNLSLIQYKPLHIVPKVKPINDILTNDESTLKRKDVGKRYLYVSELSVNAKDNKQKLQVHFFNNDTKEYELVEGKNGAIYTVKAVTDESGLRRYYYVQIDENDQLTPVSNNETTSTKFDNCVENLYDGFFYQMEGDKIVPITLDLNNYKAQYSCASTPWVVSEIKGSAEHVELTKLFRFHTISDGESSNTEVKVSIEGIDPDNGCFDVIVRDFNDVDSSPIVLERYKNCTLIPGDSNYIALKIGSYDEQYETVSNYITVEVNETELTKNSIPSGFLGYPVRDYNGAYPSGELNTIKPTKPYFKYNTECDEEVRINKQYFGISDRVGIDTDILKYKGIEAYNSLPSGLTPCFHLDSRINSGAPQEDGSVIDEVSGIKQTVSVDGTIGYEWITVGKNNITEAGIEPRIGTEEVMTDTIYEDKKYRKFTMVFYGGFDGWDCYRKERTNTDNFKYSKYKGSLNTASGKGENFSIIREPQNLGFESTEKCINSDWYAYMAGVNILSNPKEIDINVLATPGIDYVNQKTLVESVISMVEEERADSIYVVTTPDKPSGATDAESDMYSPDEVVWNLEDSEIDSNYACTYYPWVKYYDDANSSYIYLPVTKDVVRNFAYTDNTAYPWFAAAGWNRGGINGVKPKKTLKLAEQDILYDGRINFVNTFAQEGMKIWGDNNLQVLESQMNKISKRRLLLRIRKLCSIACVSLLFDPNDNTVKQSFKSAIEPIMNDIMSNRGIQDWRLEIDDSQEARDRLELPAKIYIKPTPTLEYITIDFVITPSGTNWDDV